MQGGDPLQAAGRMTCAWGTPVGLPLALLGQQLVTPFQFVGHCTEKKSYKLSLSFKKDH